MRRVLVTLLATAALCLGAGTAQAQEPMVLQHQGYHFDGVSPNSLEAFVLGWRDGKEHHVRTCIETDVRITADKRLVISHDALAWHSSPTAPHDMVIEQTPWPVLRQYPLADGSRRPTLERVIAASDRHDNGCVLVETKGTGWTPALFAHIEDEVQAHGLGARFKLYIPRWTHLMMVQRPDAAPDLKVVWKMLVDLPSDETLRNVSIDGLSCHFRDMTRANVVRLRGMGIEMYGKVTATRSQWQHTVDVNGGGFLTNSPYAIGWMARHG